MVGCADQHQLVLPEGEDLDAGAADRVGHDAEVDRRRDEVVVDLVGPAVLEVDVGGGVAAQELRQVGGQLVQADAVDGGHPEGPGNRVAEDLESVLHQAEPLQDLASAFVEEAARLGRGQASLPPLDQLAVVLLLQAANLLADGRLANVVQARGLGEALGLDDVAEDLEGFDLHGLPFRRAGD